MCPVPSRTRHNLSAKNAQFPCATFAEATRHSPLATSHSGTSHPRNALTAEQNLQFCGSIASLRSSLFWFAAPTLRLACLRFGRSRCSLPFGAVASLPDSICDGLGSWLRRYEWGISSKVVRFWGSSGGWRSLVRLSKGVCGFWGQGLEGFPRGWAVDEWLAPGCSWSMACAWLFFANA